MSSDAQGDLPGAGGEDNQKQFDELKEYKKKRMEDEAKELERADAKRKIEAARHVQKRANKRNKDLELLQSNEHLSKTLEDTKRSLRRANTVVRELLELRSGSLLGLSNAARATCLMIASSKCSKEPSVGSSQNLQEMSVSGLAME
eukprot:GFUD01127066.1.p1 GENE.GFUD01127066.1~~GFUD01127066.1.p1  ORF type:complete len:146 (+),score=47.91 GFUD01127066.1:77-514(+)